jgi:DNA invertase Pin-like site-specific DNA recombinase
VPKTPFYGVTPTSSTGRLVFGIFATLAEFERDLIKERTLAGLAAARARGRTGGRPWLMTRAKLRTAMTMMADRNNVVGDVAEQLGISVSTLYAYVDGEGRAKPRARKLLGC